MAFRYTPPSRLCRHEPFHRMLREKKWGTGWKFSIHPVSLTEELMISHLSSVALGT
jgi:hypothetical protein